MAMVAVIGRLLRPQLFRVTVAHDRPSCGNGSDHAESKEEGGRVEDLPRREKF